MIALMLIFLLIPIQLYCGPKDEQKPSEIATIVVRRHKILSEDETGLPLPSEQRTFHVATAPSAMQTPKLSRGPSKESLHNEKNRD